jgi:ectoine hydroxylase-related dioxygenase (phytanoyl-CoA dioxygenase family)
MANDRSTGLPQPTRDLNTATANLNEFGYCLVTDALSSIETDTLRTRLIEQALAEKQKGLAFEDGGPQQNWGDFRDTEGQLRPQSFTEDGGGRNQRVWMLINKGEIFQRVLFKPTVRQLVEHVLGEHYLLSSHTANIAKPGGVSMDLHTDQWWMPTPTRRDRSPLPIGSITRTRFDQDENGLSNMVSPAVVMNVLWMLDDFSANNGGTHLVPGSHLIGRQPDKELDRDVETVVAEGPAGTALVIDGRIWHGTGANVSENSRFAVITTFCGPQFRPQENFAVGTSLEVLEDASPDLLALLGFKIWNAYGRIESPLADFIQPGQTSLGEMVPE